MTCRKKLENVLSFISFYAVKDTQQIAGLYK
jgi:hypothetical protein